MKRLNFKFLIVLVVTAVAVAVGSHLLHESQAARTERIWLASAEKALEEGRLRDAFKQLAKYRRQHPDDFDRQRQAAHLAADIFKEAKVKSGKEYRQAKKLLEKTARDPRVDASDRRLLERELLEVLFAVGLYHETRELVLAHLSETPKDVELNLLAATCASVQQIDTEEESPEFFLSTIIGFLPDAQKEPFFAEDVALDANNIEAYWELARFYRMARKDKVRGDRVIQRMFEKNKDLDGDAEQRALASQAWLKHGKYRRAFETLSGSRPAVAEQKELARSEIRRAVELDPKSEEALLMASQVAMEYGEFDEAQKILESAIEHHPESMKVYQRRALLGQKMDDLEASVAAIDDALAHYPRHSDLLWMRCNYQLAMRDAKGMRDTIARMTKYNVDQTVIDVVRAFVPMCEGKWSTAATMLSEIALEAGKDPQLREAIELNLAECYGQTREYDRQLQVYEAMAADQLYGDQDAVLLGRSRALMNKQRYREANSLLRARKARGGFLSPEMLALSRQASEAVARLNGGGAASSTLTTGARRGVDDTTGSLEDWLQDNEFWRKVVSKVNRLSSSSDKSKRTEAVTFYKEALDLYAGQIPNMPEDQQEVASQVWNNNYFTYADLVVHEEGGEAGIAALDSLRLLAGDSARNVIEVSRIIAAGSESGKRKREMLQELELRAQQLPTERQADIWIRLGSAYSRTGSAGAEDSKRCWAIAANASSDDTTALQQLFALAWQAGDEPRMLEVMDSIEQQFTKNDPVWKYSRALYLMGGYGLAEGARTAEDERLQRLEALRLVDEAVEDRGNWELLFHLRGNLNDSLGNAEAALRDFENARRLGSRDPSMTARLIGMKIQRGDFAKARSLLREAGPTFPQRKELNARIEAARGSNAQAVTQAIEDVSIDATLGWGAYVRKANLYRQAAQRFTDKPSVDYLQKRAESAYREAVELGPDAPETWLVLVDFLVKAKDDAAAAEDVLRGAELQMPDEEARLLMAEGYQRLGESILVEQYLRAELATHPDNLVAMRGLADHYVRVGDVQQATEHLDRIIAREAQDDAELEHVLWARRQMARLLFQTRRHDDFHKARSHVEWNQQAKPGSVKDVQLLAMLLAMRSEPRYQREAMEVLRTLMETDASSLDFESLLRLASLHYRDSLADPTENWRQCREVMDLLLVQERKLSGERAGELRARLLAQYATMLMDRKDYPQAGRYVGELQRIQPIHPRTIRLVAKWSMLNEDQEAAEKAISQIIPPDRIVDETAPRLQLAGTLFDEQGINLRADEAFRRLAAEHASGKFELAKYLAMAGSTGEALALANELAESGDYKNACEVGLATIWQLGDDATKRYQDQVAKWFKAARKADGGDDYRLQMLEADFAVASKNPSRAVHIYRGLLERQELNYSQEGRVANNLAYVYAARGQKLDEAEELIERAMALIGPTTGLLDTKGMVYLAREECDKAIESLVEATSMDANRSKFAGFLHGNSETSAQTYFHLALAYQCADDRENAARAYATALDRGFRTDDMKPLARRWHNELDSFLNQ